MGEFALGPEAWTSWPKAIEKFRLLPQDEGKDVQFTVDLVKTERNMIIGMQVDETSTDAIVITYVNPEGLLHKWNTEKSSQNPDFVVRVGYTVAAVNGVKGLDGMKLIGPSTHVQLTI